MKRASLVALPPRAVAAMAIGIGSLITSGASAATFQLVAQSGDAMPTVYADTFRQYDGLDATPALLDGVVAFRGQGNSFSGYFTATATPGSLTSLGDSSHVFDTSPTYYSFNSSNGDILLDPSFSDGQVAVVAETALGAGKGISNPGLYLANGTQSSLSPLPTGSDYEAAQYQNGHVIYVGNSSGVFDYDITNSTTTTIASTSTPIPSGTGNFTGFGDINGIPHLDTSDGKSVFVGFGSNSQQGVYTNLSGSLTALASAGGTLPDAAPGSTFTYGNFSAVAISAQDNAVAFISSAISYPDGDAVVEYKNGVGTTVALTTTLLPGSSGEISEDGLALNDGHIAFVLDDIATGVDTLYTDLSGSLQPLISSGQTLDGHVISELSIGTQAMDGDQIAFTLTDTLNNRAIYIATVPEPASLSVVGALALLSIVRRRRGGRSVD